MKTLIAILTNLVPSALIALVCVGAANVMQGIGKLLLILVLLLIGTTCTYFISRKITKKSRPILITALASPFSVFLFIILIVNLSIWFGINGGYEGFSEDAFPIDSKYNWKYIIKINEQSRRAIWENKSLRHLNISIIDKSNHIMFHEHYRVNLGNNDRKLNWNEFNNIQLRIINVPVNFVDHKAIYGDTTEIIKLKLVYDDKNNVFKKEQEIINKDAVQN
jgi:uncharacterized protein YneF (UPF0154 family)